VEFVSLVRGGPDDCQLIIGVVTDDQHRILISALPVLTGRFVAVHFSGKAIFVDYPLDILADINAPVKLGRKKQKFHLISPQQQTVMVIFRRSQ